MQKLVFLILLYLLVFSSLAQLSVEQIHKIDSLKQVINTTKKDSVKIKALFAWDNIIYPSDKKLDLKINKQIIEICELNIKKNISEIELIKFRKSMSTSYNNLGIIYDNKGKYKEALVYFNKSLKIKEEINDKNGIAATYNNIGLLYYNQGNYEASLEHFLKTLKIKEEINSKKGMSNSYLNIGMIYKMQNNLDVSMQYYKKSLEISLQINDESLIANCYNNIGNICGQQNNYELALKYYQKSMKIYNGYGDKQGIAFLYSNIGGIYDQQGIYEKSIVAYTKGLKIFKDIGDKKGMSFSLTNIGNSYYKQGNYNEALVFADKGFKLAKDIQALPESRNASKLLYQVYRITGNNTKALKMHDLYMTAKDSLSKMDARGATLKMQLQFEYDLEKQKDSIQHLHEIGLKQTELKSEKYFRRYLFIGICFIAVCLIFVLNRFLLTRKQKNIIEDQKKEVDSAHKSLKESIEYSEYIQRAILPSNDRMKEIFSDHFIFYSPKDVVSGDFYWAHELSNKKLIALGDCTGHGVPGAFMTIMTINILNNIIEEGYSSPMQTLHNVDESLTRRLRQNEENLNDGVDLAFCEIDKEKIVFSSSHISLIQISNRELIQYKGSNVFLGDGDLSHLKSIEIYYKKGDTIYLFTDGFADQKGGKEKRKFYSKRLKELIIDNHDLSMKEQLNLFNTTFKSWKGSLEQIDDVTILGIKL